MCQRFLYLKFVVWIFSQCLCIYTLVCLILTLDFEIYHLYTHKYLKRRRETMVMNCKHICYQHSIVIICLADCRFSWRSSLYFITSSVGMNIIWRNLCVIHHDVAVVVIAMSVVGSFILCNVSTFCTFSNKSELLSSVSSKICN